MIEFEIAGQQYRAEKLSAIQQFHLSRRIAPLIPPLIPMLTQALASRGDDAGEVANLDSLAALAQPFADGLAAMPNAAAEEILNTCLSAVKRKQGDSWAAIWNAKAQMPMFAELDDLSALFPIVVRVIQESLSPFLQGLRTSQQASATATAA